MGEAVLDLHVLALGALAGTGTALEEKMCVKSCNDKVYSFLSSSPMTQMTATSLSLDLSTSFLSTLAIFLLKFLVDQGLPGNLFDVRTFFSGFF